MFPLLTLRGKFRHINLSSLVDFNDKRKVSSSENFLSIEECILCYTLSVRIVGPPVFQ